MEYINRKTGVTVSVNLQLCGDWEPISAPPAVFVVPDEIPEQEPEQKPEPVKTEKKKPAKKKVKTK